LDHGNWKEKNENGSKLTFYFKSLPFTKLNFDSSLSHGLQNLIAILYILITFYHILQLHYGNWLGKRETYAVLQTADRFIKVVTFSLEFSV